MPILVFNACNKVNVEYRISNGLQPDFVSPQNCHAPNYTLSKRGSYLDLLRVLIHLVQAKIDLPSAVFVFWRLGYFRLRPVGL